MYKIISIAKVEYKMQMKNIVTWGVLGIALLVAMLDNFPSLSNLSRLEFLKQPAYFVYRTLGLDGLILIFGLLFLTSNRIYMDKGLGMQRLFMTLPIRKEEYIIGKVLGSVGYVFSVISSFLFLNVLVYAFFLPQKFPILVYLLPLLKAIVICVLPISYFISGCAVILPALIDIRVFYLLSTVLFFMNATSVGSAGQMPFYLITSGDLSKLIWLHPKFPYISIGSITANLMFLLLGGSIGTMFLLMRSKFWRQE